MYVKQGKFGQFWPQKVSESVNFSKMSSHFFIWLAQQFPPPQLPNLMEEMPRQRIRSKIGSANLNLWPRFIGGISKPNLCI